MTRKLGVTSKSTMRPRKSVICLTPLKLRVTCSFPWMNALLIFQTMSGESNGYLDLPPALGSLERVETEARISPCIAEAGRGPSDAGHRAHLSAPRGVI